MELRGIKSVAGPGEISPGTFFLQPNHDGDHWLTLRVAGPDDGGERRPAWDLVFDSTARHGIFLTEPNGIEPAAILPPVALRVDRAARMGSAMTSMLTPGMLAVKGGEIFLVAKWERGMGRSTINLTTGEATTGSLSMGWLSFSAWSLVLDGSDGEVVLTHYDMSPAN